MQLEIDTYLFWIKFEIVSDSEDRCQVPTQFSRRTEQKERATDVKSL